MSLYWKLILRSIKDSLPRFLAIFAIICLGVGFFSGLKATTPSFYRTAEEYITGQKMYDFRLISTIGFDEDDIARLKASTGADVCTGSVFCDAVVYQSGEDDALTVRFQSLTEGVNEVTLTAGRMPSAPNEILGDAFMQDEGAIGTTITIAPDNKPGTIDEMCEGEYVIVGLARSPLYMNFQRGTTSVGSGKIQLVFFAQEAGFDFEYYSEVYLRYAGSPVPYSDEYEAWAEAKTDALEPVLEQIIMQRFAGLIEDGKEEIDDAQDEFDQEQSDAKQDLADAKIELDDALQQLEDGQKEYDDGKKELDEAWDKLQDAKSELTSNSVLLGAAKNKLDSAKTVLDSTKQQLDDAAAQLESGKQQLDDAQAQIDAGLAQMGITADQLPAQIETLNASKEMVEAQILQLMEYEAAGIDVSVEMSQANINLEQIDTMLEACNTMSSGISQLETQKAAYEDAKAQYEDGLAQYNQGYAEYLQGEAEYQAGLALYNDGLDKYNKGLEDYNEGKAKLDDAAKELEDGWAEYYDGLTQYNNGVNALNSEAVIQASYQIDNAYALLDAVKDPDTYVLGRDTNVGYVCFDNDAQIVDGVASVFPVFFFAIAALVCSTTMSRMVADERGLIGTMRGLGYTELAIVMKYVIYSGSAAVLGCVLGYLGGVKLFPWVIWEVYRMMYGFADVSFRNSVLMFVISFVFALICTVGVTVFTCVSELKGMPAELIRPKAPPPGKRIILERIGFIWSKMRFLHKVSVRNVFRFKRRMMMMIVGIAGCTALLITAFGLYDSICNVVGDQYDRILKFDVDVTFEDGVSEEDILKAAADADAKYGTDSVAGIIMVERAKNDGGGYIRDVSVFVSDDANMNSIFGLHDYKTNELMPWPSDGEVAVSSKMAEKNDLKVGDSIKILVGDDETPVYFKIGEIFTNYTYHYVMMTPATYAEATGKTYQPKELLVMFGEDADISPYDYANYIAGNYSVSTWSASVDSRMSFSNTMERMNYIIVLVVACAAALAFIVLFNLNNINITERIREIATLKVMGFYRNETGAYVTRENLLLVLMGYAAGIPLGFALHRFVMAQIEMDIVTYDVRIAWPSFFYALGFVLLFSLIVDVIMRGKIEQIDMTESLKSIE